MNKPVVILTCIVIAFGFVSGMDYDAKRGVECELRGCAYERKGDVCVCCQR